MLTIILVLFYIIAISIAAFLISAIVNPNPHNGDDCVGVVVLSLIWPFSFFILLPLYMGMRYNDKNESTIRTLRTKNSELQNKYDKLYCKFLKLQSQLEEVLNENKK